MTTRTRLRVGRQVTYFPTDAEAAAGGGVSGDEWPAIIANVNADGTANLNVTEADGGVLAVTSASQGTTQGRFHPTFGNAGRAP